MIPPENNNDPLANAESLPIKGVGCGEGSASYDVYAHLRDVQALFRAENEHCIKLAETGERLSVEYQCMRAALAKIEEICDRPSCVWDVASEALKPNTEVRQDAQAALSGPTG